MRLLAISVALLVATSPLAVAQPASSGAAPPSRPDQTPVNYGDPSTWVCRPGQEETCTTGLNAMVVTADGARSLQTFQPAADPPIDCFYVYPTVSQEPGGYSDMAATPEVNAVVRNQAGRLTSRCRLYAPLYRQITMAGLRQDMATGEHLDFGGPYRDVLAAWRWYMAHDNHGRGVVLVGHSQGAILLQRLIAEEIDGRPAQMRLVSAFLAGDPGLAVPKGAKVGGVFKSVPLCSSASQVGCVYVWSDYLADDVSGERRFGVNPGGGMVAGCVSPAATAGGPGVLEAYLPKPAMAPASDPPAVELLGQLSGTCTADTQGDVVRVSILPSRYADLLKAGLDNRRSRSGWGLHSLDVSLLQGDILDRVKDETATWTAR